MVVPTDPLYSQQWHFGLLGDIETIWNEFTGDGVHVGVYDDGLQYDHPDLSDNYDASLHFESGGTVYDPDPIAPGDGHGTAVAGLIGAVMGNGLGGVGVAYDVTLTGVNWLEQLQQFVSGNFQLELDSLAWAQNFDIMSNSWGFTPNYGSFQSLLPGSEHFQRNEQYREAVEEGRDGLGTVIVQAAGNDTLNANGDGLNSSRYTISIAAVERDATVADYSNFGQNILVSTGAASHTTDLTGSDGYDSGDFTTGFNGTSAATPVTSGVIALMLEAAPGLGWRDVQNILAVSAQMTGSDYNGPSSSAISDEVGSWFANGAENWNGGGMTFHQSYGFGLVDAFAAVRMAEVWGRMHGNAATSDNEQSVRVDYNGSSVAIPDNGTAQIELTVTENIEIESIYVTPQITHTWSSDLIVTLVGPNGEEFILTDREGGSTTLSGFEWVYGVQSARGMMSQGTWTLHVSDNAGGDVGTIDDFTIEFFGSSAGRNSVHHITDDYEDLVDAEGSRSTISDTDGGKDWLNFAAIAGDLDIDLRGGRNFEVDGDVWGSLGGKNAFERVVAGDGDDTVIGNKKDNILLGMRGEDTLKGQGGKDRLEGGTGGDKLEGQNGNDRLYGDSGRDTLKGGKGKDLIEGGTGNDKMWGNGGRDTFLFEFGKAGNDTIKGFNADDDTLRFDGGSLGQVSVSRQGGDTYVRHGGDEIKLEDVSLSKSDIDFDFL